MKLCNGKCFKLKFCGRFEEDDDDRTAFVFRYVSEKWIAPFYLSFAYLLLC